MDKYFSARSLATFEDYEYFVKKSLDMQKKSLQPQVLIENRMKAAENSSKLVFFVTAVFSCDRFCFHTRTMFLGRLRIFRSTNI